MAIVALKQEKLYQHIANTIIKLIRQGTFAVGDFLPPERVLAKQLGVSRTSLRDGLIVLEISNWVKIEPGNGVIVCGDNVSGQSGDYRTDDLLDSRIVIDAACARRAAELSDAADQETINALVDQMDQAIEQRHIHAFYSLDKQFHLSIASACQNQLLLDMSKMLWTGRVNIPYAGLDGRAEESQCLRTLNQQHRHIAQAISQRQGEQAAAYAIAHIEFVRTMLHQPVS